MAALNEMPFRRYYGSVDATPFFVVLAGAYFARTGDLAFLRTLWPAIKAALTWVLEYGDADRDGFVEYQRKAANGLVHQGWKDSSDAIFDADGRPAQGSIALCEVQAYVYQALQAGAALAGHLQRPHDASSFTERAEFLKSRFNEVFWCEEISTYGIALDGDKRLCAVRSSNAGQCLFSGIATPERALLIADQLLSPDSFSGWGIRTLPASARRFNPMSYHNGSVWPHDNGMIALGLARHGLTAHVETLFEGLLAAATYFDRFRLPELFCGFAREIGAAPVHYPVACALQAWASAGIFVLVQACLGLTIDGFSRQVRLVDPKLPPSIPDLELRNIPAGEGSTLSLHLSKAGEQVSVRVVAIPSDWSVSQISRLAPRSYPEESPIEERQTAGESRNHK